MAAKASDYTTEAETSWYDKEKIDFFRKENIFFVRSNNFNWIDPAGNEHRESGPSFDREYGQYKWSIRTNEKNKYYMAAWWEWYDEDDNLHRDGDLPAVIEKAGSLSWLFHGRLHRIGGPAIICMNGDSLWYIDGKQYKDGQDDEYVSACYKYCEKHDTRVTGRFVKGV